MCCPEQTQKTERSTAKGWISPRVRCPEQRGAHPACLFERRFRVDSLLQGSSRDFLPRNPDEPKSKVWPRAGKARSHLTNQPRPFTRCIPACLICWRGARWTLRRCRQPVGTLSRGSRRAQSSDSACPSPAPRHLAPTPSPPALRLASQFRRAFAGKVFRRAFHHRRRARQVLRARRAR